jgi:hypothetical protein
MKQYVVKVKDHEQDITHTVTEWACSQNEANAKALEGLRAMLGHDELEIAG